MAQERITSLEDLNAFGTEQPDGLWRSPGGYFFYPGTGLWGRHAGQTFEGSFSAVSTPIFIGEYSFESTRRDLQNAYLVILLA